MDKRTIKYDYIIDSMNENSTHSKIIGHVRKGSRVLEIGCASGYMTEYMKDVLGCLIWGVEIDEAAAARAERFCERIVVADIELLDLDAHLKGLSFDVIILADVIEHLKNPEPVLEKIKKYLSDEGFLLVSIPNGAHGSISLNALDGSWNYRPTGLMDDTHLRFFDRDSFNRLLESCGFFVSVIDRVIIHPRDTEFRTAWDSYPREVTAYIEKVNPEYQTYQFVIKAYPAGLAGWKQGLEECARFEKERSSKLEDDIKKLIKERDRLHSVYSAEIERLNAEISDLHEKYSATVKKLQNDISSMHFGYEAQIADFEKTMERNIECISGLETDRDNLSNHISEIRHELDEISGSLFWKVVTGYRTLIESFLPVGTRRRRLYHLSVIAVAVLFKDGFREFSKKIILKIPVLNRFYKYPLPVIQLGRMVFPVFETIRVSIVIPVFNKYNYTRRCLVSILENTSGITYEVVVVDNASTDSTRDMLASFENIVVARNSDNRGFVEACNIGASRSRGEYILFLNNDTEVVSGWLEAMCRPFDDPETGIVGAKLVYPDGRLQEAGNIIWQDATGWNYGRGDDPKKPEYCYVKKVDYCSGACLQISKTLWDDIGGFDMRYAPAYYEDTDLCFEARKRGFSVVYQPEAVVVHYEGISSGTDINKGYKRFQQLNHVKFLEKWKDILEKDHFKGPEFLYAARERCKGRRILVADHYVPEFDKDSGSLRMFSLMKILCEMGHKVVFWPENRAYNSKYTTALQKTGIEACYGTIHFDEFMKQNGSYFDYIILSRPHIAEGMIYVAKKWSNARIIYDTVDLHYIREGRKARQEAELAELEWKKRELGLANQADYTLVVSSVEKELLEKEGISSNVEVVTNIHALEDISPDFEKREGIMFIGGFMHTPNEDAMIWFVDEIWPLVRKGIDNAHFYIVGSHPSEKIRALAADDITVTGFVEDVSPFFTKSRVFVSPLRYGAGVKGKIGQSLSYGLPVVTTDIGAEGMGLIDGENALIADDAEVFAARVIELYSSPELWHRLSEGGRNLVDTRFSPEIMRKTLQQLIS